MATSKRPDKEVENPKAARTEGARSESPGVDFETPLYEEEAIKADEERRNAAADAFRNEKAHERPPRRQA